MNAQRQNAKRDKKSRARGPEGIADSDLDKVRGGLVVIGDPDGIRGGGPSIKKGDDPTASKK